MSKIISTVVSLALLGSAGTAAASPPPVHGPGQKDSLAGPVAFCQWVLGSDEGQPLQQDAVATLRRGLGAIVVLEQGDFCYLRRAAGPSDQNWGAVGTDFDHDRLAETQAVLTPARPIVAEAPAAVPEPSGPSRGFAWGVRHPSVASIEITTASGAVIHPRLRGDLWLAIWDEPAGVEPDPEGAVLRAFDAQGVLLGSRTLSQWALEG